MTPVSADSPAGVDSPDGGYFNFARAARADIYVSLMEERGVGSLR